MPSDNEILAPLVDQLVELADRPAETDKKHMWAEHQACRRGGPGRAKIPVTVYYEGMPGPIWQAILGSDYPRCADPLAQAIESDLRRRIYMAENVPDDHIVWPAVFVSARMAGRVDWGVPLERHSTADKLGAYKPIAPLADKIDLARVRFTDQRVDEKATSLAVEQAAELTAGRLAVHVSYPDLGHSPFEVLVLMRGIEQLMMDAIDRPDELVALMDAITAGFDEHHRNRERLGHINRHVSADGRYQMWGFRVHCYYANSECGIRNAELPARTIHDSGFRIPSLSAEWAYVSAQSASGFGPRQFAELVHPFNCRLSEPFTAQTVYYHGCECLDHKLDVLATLPNLRRFHVSPWSSVSAAVVKFAERKPGVVLEVHAHPGKVFFGGTKGSMRAELRERIDQAEGMPIDLNLSDIHSVNGRPETLGDWARVAQELAS